MSQPVNEIGVALFALVLAGYFVASALYISSLAMRIPRLSEWGARVLVAAFVIHAVSLGARWAESGHLPLVDLFEALSFYAWLTVLAYLAIEYRYHYRAFGAFVTPIVFLAVALASGVKKDTEPLIPVLNSGWLPVHVGISFLAYTVFTVAFGIAVVYLIQERQLKSKKPHALINRLPPLETMERLGHNAIGIGFPFMTLSIATGAVWSEQVWGTYWSWDPKETMALVTWLVYAAYFHFRDVVGWRGKRTAWLLVVGFASVLGTFLGANFFHSSLHNFI